MQDQNTQSRRIMQRNYATNLHLSRKRQKQNLPSTLQWLQLTVWRKTRRTVVWLSLKWRQIVCLRSNRKLFKLDWNVSGIRCLKNKIWSLSQLFRRHPFCRHGGIPFLTVWTIQLNVFCPLVKKFAEIVNWTENFVILFSEIMALFFVYYVFCLHLKITKIALFFK